MQNTNNKELLSKQWDQVYQSKDAKFILVGNVQGYKFRKQGNHFVVYNKSLNQKREGEILATKEKTVFLSFDPKSFNFTNVSNKQVLFHINLDEEEIISKENTHKITQKFFDKEEDEEDQIQAHTHPLLINTAPICRYHSILSMYPDQQLPQIVGSDILLLLLNIFRVLPGIKIGYNSIGGAATVNHLHFHLLYTQDLINEEKFPIQKVEKKSWLKSTLLNPNEEINLYSVGIQISQIFTEGHQALVLQSYSKAEEPIQFAQLTNSLSFVFGIIVNELIELSIPHNVLISQDGHIIYIFLRDFCYAQNMSGWLQFSGVNVVSDEKDYGLKEQEIIGKKKKLAIQNSSVQLVKSNIKKHLSKFI